MRPSQSEINFELFRKEIAGRFDPVQQSQIRKYVEKASYGDVTQIAKALLFLQKTLHGQRRKNSPEPLHKHSTRVGEGFLRSVDELINDPHELTFGIIIALLHDTVEDALSEPEQVLTEIEQEFGKRVAKSIRDRMTIPPMESLLDLYPEIVKSLEIENPKIANFRFQPAYLESGDKNKAFLSLLKEMFPQSYYQLKADLKQKSKLDKAAQLSLVEAVIKAADAVDSLLSDERDIREGRMTIYKSNTLEPAERHQDGIVSRISTARLERKIRDISIYHGALVARILNLRILYPDSLPKQAWEKLISRLEGSKASAKVTLHNLMDHYVDVFNPLLHMPDRTLGAERKANCLAVFGMPTLA